VAVDSFWEWLAFALNSGVFLLLGAELSGTLLLQEWKVVVLAAVAALGARAIVVGLVGLLLQRTTERVPRSWQAVMVWGGLRGALSLVLALALPATIGDRTLIVTLTAGAVMLSLVGQGTTMSAALRRLRILGAPDRATAG
jgi:CPA1 family monovalent cation:H+ antiporter